MAVQGPGETDNTKAARVFSPVGGNNRAASRTGDVGKFFVVATKGPSELIPGHLFVLFRICVLRP